MSCVIRRALIVPVVALAAALPLGCDLGDDSEAIPARAADSVQALPAGQREAAEALVRLESTARDRDGEALCDRVYLFAGGPSERCPSVMRKIFPTQGGYSVAVRSVRFESSDHAFADALTVTVTPSGSRERFPNTTFELRRRSGAWRVVFQT